MPRFADRTVIVTGGGMAVVIVSSELEEVLGLSHRMRILSRGRQRGILDDPTDHAVMELATTCAGLTKETR